MEDQNYVNYYNTSQYLNFDVSENINEFYSQFDFSEHDGKEPKIAEIDEIYSGLQKNASMYFFVELYNRIV